jgi:hypothetical protein
VVTRGNGGVSCGIYIRVMAQNPQNEVSFGQWLDGYISGLNDADRAGVNHGAGLYRDVLMGWITNYCISHPLDLFVDASRALVREISARQRIQGR